jgi:hypothetical protein
MLVAAAWSGALGDAAGLDEAADHGQHDRGLDHEGEHHFDQ